ncbi:MAG: hypothetical protein MUF58_04660 [Arcicella sp.]|jgi:hypothetical protein|nr:hypothetical protein [Arcicella sp.]
MNNFIIQSLILFCEVFLPSKEGDIQFTQAYHYVYAYAQKDTLLSKCVSNPKIQKTVVSPQQIPFNVQDVMCSFIQKRYQKENLSCSQINMKEGRLMQLSVDSVDREVAQIKPIAFNQSVMYNKAREPEVGYVIMFSDVYKNCLMVELRYFCNTQTDNPWAKKAMVFMFEFDKKGEIKTVYSQEKKYR